MFCNYDLYRSYLKQRNGENLGSGHSSCNHVVNRWMAEVDIYNRIGRPAVSGSDPNFHAYGHYTQVVCFFKPFLFLDVARNKKGRLCICTSKKWWVDYYMSVLSKRQCSRTGSILSFVWDEINYFLKVNVRLVLLYI